MKNLHGHESEMDKMHPVDAMLIPKLGKDEFITDAETKKHLKWDYFSVSTLSCP
jgi:hypothetical protein